MDRIQRVAAATLLVAAAACGPKAAPRAPGGPVELPGRPTPVPAQPADRGGVGVAMKAGALGAGLDVAVPVSRRLNVRAGFAAMTLRTGFEDDGIDYDGRVALRTFTGHLDWFALGGSFHISPGVLVTAGDQVVASASVPAGEMFRLGDQEFMSHAMDPVSGTASAAFPRVSPALVIGWGNIVPSGSDRWSFPLELGVVYTRSPTTSLALRGTACTADGGECRDLADEPGLRAAVEQQEDRLDAELAPLRFLPIVSLGVGYRF